MNSLSLALRNNGTANACGRSSGCGIWDEIEGCEGGWRGRRVMGRDWILVILYRCGVWALDDESTIDGVLLDAVGMATRFEK